MTAHRPSLRRPADVLARWRNFARVAVTALVLVVQPLPVSSGELRLVVLDAATRDLVPSRIHLTDETGKAVKAPGLPFWHDHFASTGAVHLSLPAGRYRWQVERGPEWSRTTGTVVLAESSRIAHTNTIRRIVDLGAEGWWSGETHVHRSPADAELLIRAEDLHVAHFITWWNRVNPWKETPVPASLPVKFDQTRFYHHLGGEDERDGGALLYLDLSTPLEIAGGTRYYPSSVVFARAARERGARWIDAEKPFWWDFPLWLAHGVADTTGIAHNHLQRGGVLENEAWGRPRDRARFPGPQGNGRWTQEIYYHALNCGLRLPPSAGSASGVLPNPPGYNRVYVQLDGELTYEKWLAGLKAGRSFVSNGPLLRARANGQWPGHVFQANGPLPVTIEARLDSNDPVEGVELVLSGRIERVHLPARFTIEESGWFLLRAVAAVTNTLRFASTAPFYVEIGGRPMKRDPESIQFFVDWCRERRAKLESLTDGSAAQREEVLQLWRQAEQFWRGADR